MVIKIGDAIPNVKLQILTSTGLQDISTEKLFRGNVIMFGIPGALLRPLVLKSIYRDFYKQPIL